ncbi:hypothetical protein CHUAL_008720 [Chamberlinius hualienensis]
MDINAVKNKSLFVTSCRPVILALALLGFQITTKTTGNSSSVAARFKKCIQLFIHLALFSVVTMSFLYQSVRLLREVVEISLLGQRYVYFRLTIFNGMISGYITFALLVIYHGKVSAFAGQLVEIVATEMSLNSKEDSKRFRQIVFLFSSLFILLVFISYTVISYICISFRDRLTFGVTFNASQIHNTTDVWTNSFNFLVAFLTHDYLIHLLIVIHISFICVTLSLRFIIKSKTNRCANLPQVYKLIDADKQMADFIQQHRQMTELVNRTDSIFSLLFFVWILTEMLNFIMLLGAMRSSDGYSFTPLDKACVVYSVYSSASLFIKPMFGSTINNLMIDWLYSVNVIDSFGSITFGNEKIWKSQLEMTENYKSPRATATQMKFKLYCENLQFSQPALTVYGLFKIDRKLIISVTHVISIILFYYISNVY